MQHAALIIFDLDDTLIDTSEVFYRARLQFLELMRANGVNEENTAAVFEEIETANYALHGVAIDRYAKSMLQTAERLLNHGSRFDDEQLPAQITACGSLVFQIYPQPITGAYELVEWASTRFDLALLTRGDPAWQLAKLDASGLREYFSAARVVPVKTAAVFQSLIAELGHSVERSWVVGDSIKADINPGLAAGARCIWYEHRHSGYHWSQEHTDQPTGACYRAQSLVEVREFLEPVTE